jgi:hypothetical protein
MSAKKWSCDECGSITEESELLSAPNPFKPDEPVLGCPVCKEIGQFTEVCDFEGCQKEATAGTPTADGYVRRCWAHSPMNKAFAA